MLIGFPPSGRGLADSGCGRRRRPTFTNAPEIPFDGRTSFEIATRRIGLLDRSVARIWCCLQIARADSPVAPDHAAKMAQGLELFHQQVRPLLLQNCFKCHGGESVESGFNMTDRDGLLKGGDTGVVVVVGKSHDSLLYKLITHAKKPHMPSEAPKLPAEAIARIAEWIDLGAPYDGPLKPMDRAAFVDRERTAGRGAQILVVSAAASCRAAGGEKRRAGAARRSIDSSWRKWKRPA